MRFFFTGAILVLILLLMNLYVGVLSALFDDARADADEYNDIESIKIISETDGMARPPQKVILKYLCVVEPVDQNDNNQGDNG